MRRGKDRGRGRLLVVVAECGLVHVEHAPRSADVGQRFFERSGPAGRDGVPDGSELPRDELAQLVAPIRGGGEPEPENCAPIRLTEWSYAAAARW
ncbi:hypothetical protein GCM10007977_086260 [Dactylosporangium sucinum]|uniref:Uncharacterized protein n=1 Tax=Dactylosporangium sucinum TaxID=1424081 RepID=A0A917UCY9_9ACTN|nr:hypothetical protein GCM10007977_086260 [Dactylosporangium sucinum]